MKYKIKQLAFFLAVIMILVSVIWIAVKLRTMKMKNNSN